MQSFYICDDRRDGQLKGIPGSVLAHLPGFPERKQSKNLEYLRFIVDFWKLYSAQWSWQAGYCACHGICNLPAAPSCFMLHCSFEANLKALSAPSWDILAKSRTETLTFKAQKDFFLLKHQAPKQMCPICTHPLWTGHSWGYTGHNAPTQWSVGHPAAMWDAQQNTMFECDESCTVFKLRVCSTYCLAKNTLLC